MHYSVSAGGSASNACNFSPARVARATTVGATDINDNRASSAAIGPCLDLFAPGTATFTAWHTSDTSYKTLSGTSFSAALVNNATPNVVGNSGTGSPNLLLFSGMIPM